MTCGDRNLAFELTFYVYTFSQGTAWKFVQLIISTFQVGWNNRKKISLFIIFQSFFYNRNINQLFSQNIHKQMKNISLNKKWFSTQITWSYGVLFIFYILIFKSLFYVRNTKMTISQMQRVLSFSFFCPKRSNLTLKHIKNSGMYYAKRFMYKFWTVWEVIFVA